MEFLFRAVPRVKGNLTYYFAIFLYSLVIRAGVVYFRPNFVKNHSSLC